MAKSEKENKSASMVWIDFKTGIIWTSSIQKSKNCQHQHQWSPEQEEPARVILYNSGIVDQCGIIHLNDSNLANRKSILKNAK